MKLIRLNVLLLSFWCASVWAASTNLVTERAWVEDPTGQMTLEQVSQATAEPLVAGHFNRGYSASTFWIRLRIDPSRVSTESPDEPLVMRIWPPYLDEVQLFDPLHQDRPQITGDLHPLQELAYRSLNLNFVLPRGNAPRDVWLRLSTTTSTLTDVEVVTESEAKVKDWRQAIGTMIYIAVLVLCLGWAVMAWMLLHDRLILCYVVREAGAIAYAFAVLGGLRAMTWTWLPPVWIHGMVNFLACFIVAIALWFDLQLLSRYRPHPGALWVLRAGVAGSAIAAVIAVAGSVPLAFQLNSWVAVLSPLVLLATAFSTRAWSTDSGEQHKDFPRWALVGLYLLMPLLILLQRAVLLGWVPPVLVAAHVALAYLLFGSVMMMVLLQMRAFRLYRRQQEVHLRLRLAEQLAKEERERREEQEKFLAMLGHELRNPLAAVGMLADESTEEGRQIRRAVRDMAQVLERSVQSGRLADARFEPSIGSFDLHVLMRDVCARSDRVDLINFAPATTVHSDRMCLLIAFGNLVDNALKYSPPESRVCVVCTQKMQDGLKTLSVRISNEPGVAGWPDAQQIFQKYYRNPKAHHQIGSGLGLYLTKSLLDMLKAQIVFVPPSGSAPQHVVFQVDLPVAA